MVLLWILVSVGAVPILIYVGWMVREIDGRPSVHNMIPGPRLLDNRARNGQIWLLVGEDGQLCEGRYLTPKRSARAFRGRASEYSAGWLDWQDEELPWTPIAYMPCLVTPTQGPRP